VHLIRENKGGLATGYSGFYFSFFFVALPIISIYGNKTTILGAVSPSDDTAFGYSNPGS